MGGYEVGRGESGAAKEVHTCSHCKQQFATAESLQLHINSSHKSGKNFDRRQKSLVKKCSREAENKREEESSKKT